MHRAVQPAHAAENYHHQDNSRLVPGENFRIDETELASGEITGKSGERAGEDEGGELIAKDRKADGAHALLR